MYQLLEKRFASQSEELLQLKASHDQSIATINRYKRRIKMLDIHEKDKKINSKRSKETV